MNGLARPTAWVAVVVALALVGALAGCGLLYRPRRPVSAAEVAALIATPAPDTLGPGMRVPDITERRVLARAARDAVRVRGLAFRGPVRVAIATPDGMTSDVRAHAEPESVARQQLTLRALGMWESEADLADLFAGLVGTHVPGYFDPRRRLVVIGEEAIGIADFERETARGEWALAGLRHEFVHALQDQHYGLLAKRDAATTTDARAALAALVEGDATLASLGRWWRRGGGLEELTRDPTVFDIIHRYRVKARDAVRWGGPWPAWLPVALDFPYDRGFTLVGGLHARDRWRAVNGGLRRPPRSTEQVIHPERYRRDERPVKVELAPYPPLLARGFSAFPQDSIGELGAALYFMSGLPIERAWEAADGWAGDTLQTYRGPSGEAAVIWALLWDDDAQAREAAEAAEAAIAVMSPEMRPRAALVTNDRWLVLAHGLPAEMVAEFKRLADGGRSGQE